MSFVPNTDNERKQMLDQIGVSSFEELINIIPEEIRLKKDLNLPPRLSELEAVSLLQKISDKNITTDKYACFMGGGAYDHFIPAMVGAVLERPEFKTAYTPYQAEVSQGTLQAMYEFQSMICQLTGMDIANASMYDGGTALAEACLLSHAHNRKSEFVIAGALNPNYKRVVNTVCSGRELSFKEAVAKDGTCDLDLLKTLVTKDISAVIVQHPNYYGNLEQVHEIEKIAHEAGCLYIVSVNPLSLGILEPPCTYNADIVVGEGQPLGIPLGYGGPYLGIFAAKNALLRKIPGRLSGITEDTDGNRGFVLTLQTREQQIKREKATSNICTNEGLYMLAATVYMETMGKQGIKEVAEQSYHKAHYLASKIKELSGFSLLNDKPFFCEFLVKTPVAANKIIDAAQKAGILAGINTADLAGYESGLLIAVTEKRTKEEMDNYVEVLKQFAK